MKPPRFDYHAPATVDEAIALLTRYGGEAKLLAGGQSLMPLLNFRLSRPGGARRPERDREPRLHPRRRRRRSGSAR